MALLGTEPVSAVDWARCVKNGQQAVATVLIIGRLTAAPERLMNHHSEQSSFMLLGGFAEEGVKGAGREAKT
jgi:hypothetical protein